MRLSVALAAACVAAFSAPPALAEGELTSLDEEELALERPPPSVSTELLDPSAHSRFQLITRASFAGPDAVFADAGSVWVFEPKVMVQVTRGFALGGEVPLALDAPSPGADAFLLGNVRLSAESGLYLPLDARNDGLLGPRVNLGFGLDIYLPTQTRPSGPCRRTGSCTSAGRARGLRAYEPALFTPDAALVRARGQVGFSVEGFQVAGELGFTPGWYIRGTFEAETLVLYGFALRAAYSGFRWIEPFAELVGSGTLEGPTPTGRPLADPPSGEPVQLSLGARLFYRGLAPALFVTVDPSVDALFFGLDIAGILMPTVRAAPKGSKLSF